MSQSATSLLARGGDGGDIAVRVESPDLFQDLRRRVDDAGLLGTRKGYYAVKMVTTWAFVAAGWAVFVMAGDTWWQLLTAAYLGFWAVQIGLLGHDAGHRQISRSRRIVELLGFTHGNLALGMSYGWWIRHHNRHHSEPNHLEEDPDIARRKAIFVKEQAAEREGFDRFVARHQRWAFWPMKLLEAVGLRSSSLAAIRSGEVDRPRLEAAAILLHFAAFVGVAFWILSPAKAVAFLLVHQVVFGLYLGLSFATNHKGMPLRRNGDALGWLERQVVTARNLRSNSLVTFLYGGLNYQIEHHLFPMMARPNLKHAVPIVRDFCREHDIPYEEVGVFESYRKVAGHLAETSAAATW